MKTWSGWICVALLCFAAKAEANLRAPQHLEVPPSSFLYRTDPGLVVAGEDLRFSCSRQRCEVVAIYQVEAAAAGTYGFEFVLPAEAEVEAACGEQVLATRVGLYTPAGERERDLAASSRDGGRLYRASFTAALRAGVNSIRVSYPQPLSFYERDYGYFRDGRLVHVLQYEIWPLQEWKRSDSFRIRLEVRLERKPPGFWKRHFGTVQTLACETRIGAADPKSSPVRQEPVQDGDFLVLASDLTGTPPDRLLCWLGDEDLVVHDP